MILVRRGRQQEQETEKPAPDSPKTAQARRELKQLMRLFLGSALPMRQGYFEFSSEMLEEIEGKKWRQVSKIKTWRQPDERFRAEVTVTGRSINGKARLRRPERYMLVCDGKIVITTDENRRVYSQQTRTEFEKDDDQIAGGMVFPLVQPIASEFLRNFNADGKGNLKDILEGVEKQIDQLSGLAVATSQMRMQLAKKGSVSVLAIDAGNAVTVLEVPAGKSRFSRIRIEGDSVGYTDTLERMESRTLSDSLFRAARPAGFRLVKDVKIIQKDG